MRADRDTARREAFRLARDSGAAIVTRPMLRRGKEPAVRDAEPLAGARAARDLELAAHRTARDYIRQAREAGHGWEQIGEALGLAPAAAPASANPSHRGNRGPSAGPAGPATSTSATAASAKAPPMTNSATPTTAPGSAPPSPSGTPAPRSGPPNGRPGNDHPPARARPARRWHHRPDRGRDRRQGHTPGRADPGRTAARRRGHPRPGWH